jgi:hypothetical protein
MIRVLVPFAPLFSKRVWRNAQVLLMGGKTVSSALRVMTSKPPVRRLVHPTGSGAKRPWSPRSILFVRLVIVLLKACKDVQLLCKLL